MTTTVSNCISMGVTSEMSGNGHLKKSLENFLMNSSNREDRERAMDMLNVINKNSDTEMFGKQKLMEYKIKSSLRRPKTAHATINGSVSLNRFTTSYTEDYPRKTPIETIAERPSSTMNIIARPNNIAENAQETLENKQIIHNHFPTEKYKNLSDYLMITTYNKDYNNKKRSYSSMGSRSKSNVSEIPPERCATASGARCHNPHPQKEFLVWRIPRQQKRRNKHNLIPSETILMKNEDNAGNNGMVRITDNQFDQVMRGKCRSIYRSDYNGGDESIQNDKYEPLYLHPVGNDPKYVKWSTQRIDYDRPKTQSNELKVPHDRFGSSTRKTAFSSGIIPGAVNKIYLKSNNRTTYDEDVNDRAKVIYGKIVEDIQSKIDFSKINNLKDIERAMIQCDNEADRQHLQRLCERLSEPTDFKRKSFVRKPHYPSSSSQLAWSSNWAGPLSY